MPVYDAPRQAATAYFKLIRQAEKKHGRLKTACILIEIRFRQVYRTDTSEMCYRRTTGCAYGFLRKAIGYTELWQFNTSAWRMCILCGDFVRHMGQQRQAS